MRKRMGLFNMEDSFSKSRDLIKKATSYKNTNIEKAIALIQKAIKLCPEKMLTDYFKLANYYYIANCKDKAYSIHQEILAQLNQKDITMYNMKRASVFEKLCTLSYKDKEFKNYLYYYCLWFFNLAVAFACQGRKGEFEEMLNNQNKLVYLASSKINSSFKKLGKEGVKKEFNTKLDTYYSSITNTLTNMVKKAYRIDHSMDVADYRAGESIGETKNRLLRKEGEFMTAYNALNSGDIERFFEDELSPLLEA